MVLVIMRLAFYLTISQIDHKKFDFESKNKPTKLGVPQGSSLGSIFFLIFINDLSFFIKNCESKLFADDTTLYKTGANIETLILDFKRALSHFLEWCKFNKLDINWSKTEFMFVHDKRKILLQTFITIDGCDVKVVSSF